MLPETGQDYQILLQRYMSEKHTKKQIAQQGEAQTKVEQGRSGWKELQCMYDVCMCANT